MTSINAWQARGHSKNLLGYNIFVIDEGQANKGTILFIHGFPTASWDFSKIWDELSQNYRLVALDMLGFGFSDKPEKHIYSIHEQADIVEALAQDLKLENFHVLAHDYGDSVAQELLARQNAGQGAGQWLSLCLLNGGLFPETHKALLIQKLLLSPLGPLVNKLTDKKRFDKSVSKTFGPQTKPSAVDLDSFWALVNHNNGRHIFHNLITYISDRQTHRERWISALKDAKLPIALINGSVDPVSGSHMVDRYLEIINTPAYLARLDDIGHYPQVEAPDDVSKHYKKFLSQIQRPS